MIFYLTVAFGYVLGSYYAGQQTKASIINGLAWPYFAFTFVFLHVKKLYKDLPDK